MSASVNCITFTIDVALKRSVTRSTRSSATADGPRDALCHSRYDYNVRSKADMSQLNLPHGNNN